MDQNEKFANDKITKLENEIKVLKNEVQAVLLDLRESYLNMENPFNTASNPAAAQSIVITESAQAPEPKEEQSSEESLKPESIKAEDPPAESIVNNTPEPGISPRELKTEFDDHLEMKSRFVKSSEAAARKNARLDLVTVAGLTGWVEESTQKLGRERTGAVMDISEAMGYVTADLKPILEKLIQLAPQSPVETTTRTHDYIDSLIKLNGLLSTDNREETALLLLSLVSGDKIHG